MWPLKPARSRHSESQRSEFNYTPIMVVKGTHAPIFSCGQPGLFTRRKRMLSTNNGLTLTA
jgi:hypothetical protein